MIKFLCQLKVNSTVLILISQALIDLNINHEEFVTIFKEKDRYEKMKENIKDKNEHEKQEIIKMSSIKQKN